MRQGELQVTAVIGHRHNHAELAVARPQHEQVWPERGHVIQRYAGPILRMIDIPAFGIVVHLRAGVALDAFRQMLPGMPVDGVRVAAEQLSFIAAFSFRETLLYRPAVGVLALGKSSTIRISSSSGP